MVMKGDAQRWDPPPLLEQGGGAGRRALGQRSGPWSHQAPLALPGALLPPAVLAALAQLSPSLWFITIFLPFRASL